jgi:hypothetical protein
MSKGAYKNGKKEGRWVSNFYIDEGDRKASNGVFKNGVKVSD